MLDKTCDKLDRLLSIVPSSMIRVSSQGLRCLELETLSMDDGEFELRTIVSQKYILVIFIPAYSK